MPDEAGAATMIVVAAAFAALTTWLLVAPWRDGRAARLAPGGDGDRTDPIASIRRLWDRVAFGPARRRRRARDRVRVLQALSALAAELDAGAPVASALVSSAGVPAAWPRACRAARSGGDIVTALRQDGERHEVLAHLAACWQVAADSGAGLSAAVAALTASARTAEDVRVQLEAELAGPRATARTLAVLPLVGLAFGSMLGGDPLGWLVQTPTGRICIIVGVALTLAGVWWTALIARSVERLL